MGWRVITEQDLLSRISGPELNSFRQAALAEGQDDPIDDSITQVTNLVRGSCGAYNGNVLGAVGTIPESLIGAALDILVVDIQTRAAGILIDPDDIRKDRANAAKRLLERVAEGKFAIDEADGGDGQQSTGGASIANKRTSRVSRDNLRGF